MLPTLMMGFSLMAILAYAVATMLKSQGRAQRNLAQMAERQSALEEIRQALKIDGVCKANFQNFNASLPTNTMVRTNLVAADGTTGIYNQGDLFGGGVISINSFTLTDPVILAAGVAGRMHLKVGFTKEGDHVGTADRTFDITLFYQSTAGNIVTDCGVESVNRLRAYSGVAYDATNPPGYNGTATAQHQIDLISPAVISAGAVMQAAATVTASTPAALKWDLYDQASGTIIGTTGHVGEYLTSVAVYYGPTSNPLQNLCAVGQGTPIVATAQILNGASCTVSLPAGTYVFTANLSNAAQFGATTNHVNVTTFELRYSVAY